MKHTLLIITVLMLMLGCGSSNEEQQTKEAKEKEEQQKASEDKIEEVFSQISKKYNAVYFPPENFGDYPFTYEIQEFFKTHAQNIFIFKAYLEDIEQTEKGTIIEFLCPLGGEDYWGESNENAIRFRLSISDDSISDDSIKQFKGTRKDLFWHEFRYMYAPDYYVIATVENTEKARVYIIDGIYLDEEVEIDTDMFRSIISTGKFIDAVSIPEE